MATEQQCENFYEGINSLNDKYANQALNINDLKHENRLLDQRISGMNSLLEFLKFELSSKAEKASVDKLEKRVDEVCKVSEENNKVLKIQNKYLLLVLICLGFFTFLKMSEEFPELLPTFIRFIKFIIDLAKYL